LEVDVLTDVALFLRYREHELNVIVRGSEQGDDLLTILSFE